MSDKSPHGLRARLLQGLRVDDVLRRKWELPFWSAGAVLFGGAFVYEMVRDGFDLFQLAMFVFFMAMAVQTWQKRRKG